MEGGGEILIQKRATLLQGDKESLAFGMSVQGQRDLGIQVPESVLGVKEYGVYRVE